MAMQETRLKKTKMAVAGGILALILVVGMKSQLTGMSSPPLPLCPTCPSALKVNTTATYNSSLHKVNELQANSAGQQQLIAAQKMQLEHEAEATMALGSAELEAAQQQHSPVAVAPSRAGVRWAITDNCGEPSPECVGQVNHGCGPQHNSVDCAQGLFCNGQRCNEGCANTPVRAGSTIERVDGLCDYLPCEISWLYDEGSPEPSSGCTMKPVGSTKVNGRWQPPDAAGDFDYARIGQLGMAEMFSDAPMRHMSELNDYLKTIVYLPKVAGSMSQYSRLVYIDAGARELDFAAWLRRNVRETDFVALKMDIEGSEHTVLKHMHETGTLQLVDELFLECHGNFWGELCHHCCCSTFQH